VTEYLPFDLTTAVPNKVPFEKAKTSTVEPGRKPDPENDAEPPVMSTTVALLPLPVVALVAITSCSPCPVAVTESPLSVTPILVVEPPDWMTSAVPGLSSEVVVPFWKAASLGVTGEEAAEMIDDDVGSSELAATVKV
jgi:hypothetical protein